MSLLLNRLHFVKMEETTEGDIGGGSSGAEQTAPSAEEMAGAETPVDGSAELDFDGLSAILNTPDPFAEIEGEATPSEKDGDGTAQPDGGTEEVTANAEASSSEPGKTETPTPGEKPEATEAAPQETPEMALMRQSLETQKQLIESLQAGGEDKGGEKDTPPDDSPQVPEYNFSIPDGLMTLMDSEDPAERRQGVAAMAQGVATTVHKQILEQVQGMFTSVVPQTVMGVIQQQNQSKAIFEDFYGTHKDLNREELKPVIVQVAEQVWKETKAQQWSPELRDTIAAKVKLLLTQGTPTPPTAPGKKPTPPADPGSTRQSRANNANSGASNLANDVGSLLF